MQQYKTTIVYGFALFAMFFGSGNLVFPIQIGYLTGSNWFLGFLGLFITGVLLPFLGLFVIKIHKGDYNSFFGEAGTLAKILIPLFTLSLLGSFAVVPRCIIVAYGSVTYIFPEMSLGVFSFIFCVITFFFCIKDQVMMSILGKWMSPILLVALIILIVAGFSKADVPEIGSNRAFREGFLTGYQTMDLFAAFFFSSLVFNQIQNSLPSETKHKRIIYEAIKSSIFGATLLGLIYLGFVFLGSHYIDALHFASPEKMLGIIANKVLGENATLFIVVAMLLSCLTTAVALNNIYSRYIYTTLSIKSDKFWMILLGVTAVAFLVSLLNFQGITRFLAPVLEVSYPGLIALTILSICFKGYKRFKILVFYGLSISMVIKMMIN